MTDLDIQELANLTAGDADVDNFERLFTKLKEMKGNEEKHTHTNNNSHDLSVLLLKITRFLFVLILHIEVKPVQS